MTTDEPPILTITPAPSDAELAAITVAFALFRHASVTAAQSRLAPVISRWARTGRLAAMGVPEDGRGPWWTP